MKNENFCVIFIFSKLTNIYAFLVLDSSVYATCENKKSVCAEMDLGNAWKCQKLEKKSFKKHEITKEDDISTYLAVSELNLADGSSGGIDLNLVGNFGKKISLKYNLKNVF